ncbi:hypothetical protein GPECTOR_57g447 [Gonium pectorale]|uniref:Uncharacterized protein n=1 Tax=Gonium pectorale TaxID=33097 RepID=A0A150G5N4_GONPE|nr:hypothetical protein GPECTOR_57g447 [Gonium pectorale]|eukprot:KXZ45157.1 hypothetical protein GPECTOR_57g447 [Gonium pectorale]
MGGLGGMGVGHMGASGGIGMGMGVGLSPMYSVAPGSASTVPPTAAQLAAAAAAPKVEVYPAHLVKLCVIRAFAFAYLTAHVVQVSRGCRSRGEPLWRYAGSVHLTFLGALLYGASPIMALASPATYARWGAFLNTSSWAITFTVRAAALLLEPAGLHDMHVMRSFLFNTVVHEGLGVCLGGPGRPLYVLFLAAALWRLLELPPRAFQWAVALRLATLVHHATMLYDTGAGGSAGHLHPLIRTSVLSVGGYVGAHVLLTQAVPAANLAAAAAAAAGRRLPPARRWLYGVLSTSDGAVVLGVAALALVHLLTSVVDVDAYRSIEVALVMELVGIVQTQPPI